MSYKIKLYWELSDEALERLYEIGRQEGVLDHALYDVSADLNLFLIFARKAEVFGSVYAQNGEEAGFFYLDSFEGSTARLHFCFFKAGRERRHEIGRQVLNWCFETFEFKCLKGLIPVINSGAIRYAGEMGGRFWGFIPGNCWLEKLRRTVAGALFIFLRPAGGPGRKREAH